MLTLGFTEISGNKLTFTTEPFRVGLDNQEIVAISTYERAEYPRTMCNPRSSLNSLATSGDDISRESVRLRRVASLHESEPVEVG